MQRGEKGLQVLRDHVVEHRAAGIPRCVGGHRWCHTSPHGQQGESGSARRRLQLYCSFVQYTSKKVDEGMRRKHAGYTPLLPSLCVIRTVAMAKVRLFFLYAAGSYALHTPAIDGMCETLSHTLSRFHTTHVPGHGACAVLHHFWVERRICHACGALFELHPHYQLAYSKDTGCQWVFCQRCHQVYELSLRRHVLACACGARTRIHRGTVRQGTV